jgi:hypothetical protein
MKTQEYRIQKLKEFAEREDQKEREEAEAMADLKKIRQAQLKRQGRI